jgi:glycosyltransferase involved in cell wall biosynthesis
VIADDDSSDGSAELYAQLIGRYRWLTVVRLSRRFGHQAAISAALSRVRGDAIVCMDADLQDPPEIIPELVARWRDGAEVVTAVKRSRREPLLRRLAYGVFHRFLPYAVPLRIPATAGTFSLLDARVARLIVGLSERNRFLPGLRSWVGFKQSTVPFDRAPRGAGRPAFRTKDLVGLAIDAIFGFSYRPLRLATILGLIAAAVAVVLLVAALYFRLFTRLAIPGWASLTVAIAFFGGAQLFALGMIGEYLARVADEVVGRPYFVVREELGARSAARADGEGTPPAAGSPWPAAGA